MKICSTALEAVQCIHSANHLFIHSAAAIPTELVSAMTQRSSELKHVSIYSIHTEGIAPYAAPEMADSFYIKPFFIGHNIRSAIQDHRGSYIPTFLSEVPDLFLSKQIPLDVALISVSPPDKHGYCSLGTSVDITLAAIRSAKIIVAQINAFMPRTHGDGFIHSSSIDYAIT